MEEKTTKESARKKAELLLHHLKPAASASAAGYRRVFGGNAFADAVYADYPLYR